jgi:phosphopentomutase
VKGSNLGTRNSFADVAATAADFFGLRASLPGTSMIREVI